MTLFYKKSPDLSVEALCWRYLSFWVGQVLSWHRNSPVDCCSQNCLSSKKKTAHFRVRFVLALPIFPGSRPPSIVGANELNFCVRDGNRWTLIAINTNYKHRLRCFLNVVTHTGFEPMLTA